mmetsp:Transcript_146843/g.381617  ORF Transcript_146843/g.381617 Transcript_146843/m.381617 type:complete len:319 (+) Transcript_146843:215-1171(+)
MKVRCSPHRKARRRDVTQAMGRWRTQPHAPSLWLHNGVPSPSWLHDASLGAAGPPPRLPCAIGLLAGGTWQEGRPKGAALLSTTLAAEGEEVDGAGSAVSSAMRLTTGVPMKPPMGVLPGKVLGRPARAPLTAEDVESSLVLLVTLRAMSPRENGTNTACVSLVGEAHGLPTTGLACVPGEDEARGLPAANGEGSSDAAGFLPRCGAGAKGHSFRRQAVVATSLGVQRSPMGDAASGAPKATGLGEQTSGELVGEGHTVNAAVKGVSSEPCKQALLGPGAHGHRRVRHCVVAALMGVTRVGAEHDEGDGLGEAYAWPG